MEAALLVEEIIEDSGKPTIASEDLTQLELGVEMLHYLINRRMKRIHTLDTLQLKRSFVEANENLKALNEINQNKILISEVAELLNSLIRLFKIYRGKLRTQIESPLRQAIYNLAPQALNESLRR